MGLFSGSSGSSDDAPPPEQTLPTRSARKECWATRDAYFACLTSKEIIIPPGIDMNDGRPPAGAKNKAEEAQKLQEKEARLEKQRESDPCIDLRKKYEGHCAHSWIDYFGKRRVMEERQRITMEHDTKKYGRPPTQLGGNR